MSYKENRNRVLLKYNLPLNLSEWDKKIKDGFRIYTKYDIALKKMKFLLCRDPNGTDDDLSILIVTINCFLEKKKNGFI